MQKSKTFLLFNSKNQFKILEKPEKQKQKQNQNCCRTDIFYSIFGGNALMLHPNPNPNPNYIYVIHIMYIRL